MSVHALLLMVTMLLAGCIPITQQGPEGSGVTRALATDELLRLSSNPAPVQRPIVFLSGYHTPAMHAGPLAARIVKATSGRDEDILLVSYPMSSNIDDITRQVITEVEQRWPSECPHCTAEVDVIGVSMGGIIARWAALPPAERIRDGESPAPSPAGTKRLNVVRLFTYASPHRGARLAISLALDAAAVDLKPGSSLLTTLDRTQGNQTYELTCYAHTRDLIVGATHTSPPGMNPIWTEGTVMFSHMAVVHNPIFIADTARRLRGEPALVEPTLPPPRD